MIAEENGFAFSEYDAEDFYQSVAFNGLTGVSTVIVSNEVGFSAKREETDKGKAAGNLLSSKLRELKDVHEQGLLTDSEYEGSKKRLLDKYESTD